MANEVNFVFYTDPADINFDILDDKKADASVENEKKIHKLKKENAKEVFNEDVIEEIPPEEMEKHWMFMENVRLSHERQEIEEEWNKLKKDKKEFERLKKAKENELAIKEKQLVRQKELFDKQWGVIEKELHRIAADKDRIAREKSYIEREKANLKAEQNKANATRVVTNGAFFVGVNSESSLKKRYRELIKIYHPDSGNGDEATLLLINKEFERLKRNF